MTLANQSNLIPKLLETVGTLDTGGTDSILGAFRLVRNQAMWLKRSHVLGALHSEHFEGRHSHASGFKDGGKDKILKARLGEVTVRISQTRGGAFYLQSLERSRRSEKARAGHRRDVGDGGFHPQEMNDWRRLKITKRYAEEMAYRRVRQLTFSIVT